MFEQQLRKKGLTSKLKQISDSVTTNSDDARLFKQLMNEGRLVLPWDSGMDNEIKKLTQKISGHYIKVEDTSGHDDRWKALLKSLRLCFDDKLKDRVSNPNSAIKKKRDYQSAKKNLRQYRKRDMKNIVV